MKRVIILGSGISGLSLGWFLKRRFGHRLSLQILEQSDRAGGWIQTVQEQGFLFEQGPRSIRTSGSGIETLYLLKQLEMESETIIADQAAFNRYLLVNKRLHRVPNGLFSFLLSPWMWKVIPACLAEVMKSKGTEEDESIYSFFQRRFSSHIAEQLIDPLASGIYAGDIRQLSIKSCFPQLYSYEKEKGSVIRGALSQKKSNETQTCPYVKKMSKGKIISLSEGIESLIDALVQRLEGHLNFSSKVTAIHCTSNEAIVELENGNTLEADHLYSTLPAHTLSSLLGREHQELTSGLEHIPSTSIATVNFGYHRKVLRKKGFGYLVPSCEEEQILGVVWDSSVFPQQNQIPEETRLTVMIGGVHRKDFSEITEQKSYEIARNAIQRHLHIEAEPDVSLVKISHQAIPQYLVGHAFRVSQIKGILSKIFPRLTIHGSSFHGVSVNDCIARSKHLDNESRKTLFAKNRR